MRAQSPQTWPVGQFRNICDRYHVQITDTVLAAWAVVVWQYLGRDDLTFWSQHDDEDENAGWIKYSTSMRPDTSFATLLGDIRDGGVSCDPPESTVQSRFGFEMATATVWRSGDSRNSPFTETDSFTGLLCNLSPSNVQTVVRLGSSGQSRHEEEVRIAATLGHVIATCLKYPARAIESLDLVCDGDKQELFQWNKEQASEPVRDCVQNMFQQRVALRPNSLAVDAWDGRFTYEQLHHMSSQVARFLVTQGVGPEFKVPICMDKSRWAIVALMGAVQAGGAIVFIDPEHPTTRQQSIYDQLGANFILTDASHAALWRDNGSQPIVIDGDFVNGLDQTESHTVNLKSTEPDALLYVIFTSGSTGKPKGCLVPHTAFLSGAVQHAAKSNLDEGSRVLQLASYSFDVSMLEIMTSLISGACVCTPGPEVQEGLAAVINRYNITWTFLTPSLVKLITPEQVPTIKTLALGGERLDKIDIETWAEHLQLINGYGPTECSVAATGDPNLVRESDPANVGRSVGGLCWIVNVGDHDKLVPTGAVGELLISGPIVARGYLDNPEQTARSFIDAPSWCRGSSESLFSQQRFYKTGDIARLNSNGTLSILGRKDFQIKLRGLRIELGEIESHLSSDELIRQVAVFMPSEGPFRGKLVSVATFSGSYEDQGTSGILENSEGPIQLVNDPKAASDLNLVRMRLAKAVPDYMIPTCWVIIAAWPLLTSAKLDRKSVERWLVERSDEEYARLTDWIEDEPSDSNLEAHVEHNETLDAIRQVIAQVLNVTLDTVLPQSSLLKLGGDSINALQVVSRCKALGFGITVKDVLRCATIAEVASRCKKATVTILAKDEVFDSPFQLSPVQKMWSKSLNHDQEMPPDSHYNQSMYVRLERHIDESSLVTALDAVVSRHSMLRARFEWTNNEWKQRVLSKVHDSYRFCSSRISTIEETGQIAHTSQRSLSHTGPVFSADLITLVDENQYLFFVGHHAVVDWVSWRIILSDLEACLESSGLHTSRPLPFQTWVNLQADNARDYGGNLSDILPFEAPRSDFAYWGMEGKTNTIAQTRNDSFHLDAEVSAELLNGAPHRALETETIDFFLASLFMAFAQVFDDRECPAIFREGHGREPWDAAIDVSDTVGWFTTLYPLAVDRRPGESAMTTLMKVKDRRRAIPDNGRPYFAARAHNEDAAARFRAHDAVEVSFDYLGQFQNLQRKDAIIKHETRPIWLSQEDDIGKNAGRHCLVEITAEVIDGRIQFLFVYNQLMNHQGRLLQWIKATKVSIESLVAEASNAARSFTLADFPLLSWTYDGLDTLQEHHLPKAGITDLDLVEDIFPCSSVQQGILMNQKLSVDNLYESRTILEVTATKDGVEVDPERLKDAWIQVVQRHSSLRTFFIDSVSQDGLYDQVILKKIRARALIVESQNESEALSVFSRQETIPGFFSQPLHQLTICRLAPSRALCQIQINHAIIDGGSHATVIHEISDAYHGRLSDSPAFRYRDYVAHIKTLPIEGSKIFWSRYLAGQKPCLLPPLSQKSAEVASQGSSAIFKLELETATRDITSFCTKLGVAPASLFQVAWAMVLSLYTEDNTQDVCFGQPSSGRGVPVAGIESGVGAFLQMLVCRVELSENMPISDIIRKVAGDFADCLEHEHLGLAGIQNAVGVGDDKLFNTCLTVRSEDNSPQTDSSNPEIVIKTLSNTDRTEYIIAANVAFDRRTSRITLEHWTGLIRPEQVAFIAGAFSSAVAQCVQHGQSTFSQLSLIGKPDLKAMELFNGEPIAVSERLVFEAMDDFARSDPGLEAISSWEGSWSYSQLSKTTTRLGNHLRSLGIGPGIVVPLCFEKSTWAVVAMISILKAGGAFAALDVRNPRNRLQALVSQVTAGNAEGGFVCGSPGTRPLFEGLNSVQHFIAIDEDYVQGLSGMKTGTSALRRPRPNDIAWIIFTSGTTGTPKAIAIEHRSASTFADCLGPQLGLSRISRVFQFSAYPFDLSCADIFITLQRGGCVCVPSEDERMNDIPGAIKRLQANWMLTTNTVLATFRPEQAPSLQRIFTAGEQLERRTIGQWAEATHMSNTYGPAETTIIMTISDRLTKSADVSNIGRAVGSRVWIVDAADHNKLVPIGATGELVIEGPLLARGYFGNSEATSRAFAIDPAWSTLVSPNESLRVYKSGDICRFNVDGTLTIIGRRDAMVKVNGQRVELDDISHHLEIALDNKASVCVENVGGTGKSRLVAFIHFHTTPDEKADQQAPLILPADPQWIAEISRAKGVLASHLPKYMIPSAYVPISSKPMTFYGKLDRGLLRRAYRELSQDKKQVLSLHHQSTRKPETNSEKTLARLWGEVLEIPADSLDAHDGFFHIGGDSVSAIKLVAAAREELLHLSVVDIFKCPRLLDMALAMASLHNEANGHNETKPFSLIPNSTPGTVHGLKREAAAQCSVKLNDIEDIYPCSPLQEELIALSMRLGPASYRGIQAFRIQDDGFNMEAYRSAWQEVVESQPVLRTRIISTRRAGIVQAVVKSPLVWEEMHIKLDDCLEQLRTAPLGYGRPLLRLAIVRDGKHTFFVWSAHHAIYDGWSIGLTMGAVNRAYNAFSLQSKPTFPSWPGSFNEYIKYVLSIDDENQRSFWASRFQDANTSALGFPAVSRKQSSSSYALTSTTLTRKIKDISEAQSETATSILYAAWALTISIFTGTQRVTMAIPQTGRSVSVANIASINGPTVGTVPISIEIEPKNTSARELASAIQTQILETIPYSHYGLRNIRKVSGASRNAVNSIANIFVVHPDDGVFDARFDGMAPVSSMELSRDVFPLIVQCRIDTAGHTAVEARYDNAAMSLPMVELVLEQFNRIVQQIGDRPQVNIASLSIHHPESAQSIVRWNMSQFDAGKSETKVHFPSTNNDKQLSYGAYMAEIDELEMHRDASWLETPRGPFTAKTCLLPRLKKERDDSAEEYRLSRLSCKDDTRTEAILPSAARVGVPPALFYQVAWAIVLSLYTEHDPKDICFGLLTNESQLPTTDTVKTRLSRVKFPEDTKLSDVMRTMKDGAMSGTSQQITMEHGSQPLFNTCLYLREEKSGDCPSHAEDQTKSSWGTSVVLGLSVSATDSSVRISLKYRPDWIEEEQARIIIEVFSRALQCLADDPQRTLSQLDLLGEQNLERIRRLNGPDPVPTSHRCIFDRIDAHANSHPTTEAIASWDRSWTYAQLSETSTRLGNHLRQVFGIGPGTVVPICFEKSSWAIVAMLSIMKAGAAFAPLDTRNPRGRLEELIKQVHGKLVLGSSVTQDLFNGTDYVKRFLPVDEEYICTLPPAAGSEHYVVTPQDLSWIIFTSGTTGTSKAIAMEHTAMATFADQVGPSLGLGPSSRMLQFASYSFDVSVGEIFSTLQAGGCVCVPSEEDRMNDLAGSICRLRATHLMTTATVVSTLQPRDVPTLQRIYCGGERLSQDKVDQWADAVRLVVCYGPAEATVLCTSGTPMDRKSKSDNIGYARGCRIWVVDALDHNKLLPIGALGEVVLEGPLLARGYFEDEKTTAHSFVNEPRWAKTLGLGPLRIYKTGDIGRFNVDRSLTLIGRRDTTIKINGQRVDLHDVARHIKVLLSEGVIAFIEAIKTHTVVLLVAFIFDSRRQGNESEIILVPDRDWIEEMIRVKTALANRLPPYMIPSAYVPISRIPHTVNGKLDSKGMQGEFLSLSASTRAALSLRAGSGRAAESAEEKLLVKLWAEVLDDDAYDAKSNFIAMGGDSVSAIRLVAALRESRMTLSVAEIFNNPQLDDMARALRPEIVAQTEREETDNQPFDLIPSEQSKNLQAILHDAADQCGVSVDEIEDMYPCSPLQEDVMALSARLGPTKYRGTQIFRLTDEDLIDVAAFRHAWHEVAVMDTILRTRIVNTHQMGVLQVVIRDDLKWMDIEGTLASYLEEDEQAPFTFGWPLLRLALVNDPTNGMYFVWSAHHAVYDGWSVGLTMEAVERAMTQGRVSRPATFKRFIKHLSGDTYQSHRSFWESQFTSNDGLVAGFPSIPEKYVSKSHKNIRRSMTANLSGIRENSATFSNLLYAAWSLTLATFSGNTSIIFAAPRTGRTVPIQDIMTINGPTTNVVPLCVSINLEQSVDDFVKDVQTQLGELMPHEHFGLLNIRRLNAQASNAIRNIASTLVIQPFQGLENKCFDGMEIIESGVQEFNTHPLIVECRYDVSGMLNIQARYDDSALPFEVLDSVLNQFNSFIKQIVGQKEYLSLRHLKVDDPVFVERVARWNQQNAASQMSTDKHRREPILANGSSQGSVNGTSSQCLSFGEFLEGVLLPIDIDGDVYWSRFLSRQTTCLLPSSNFDQPRSPSAAPGAHLDHKFEVETSVTVLRETCASLNINTSSIFQLAWAKVLAAYNEENSRDICFGLLLSSNTQSQSLRTVASCIEVTDDITVAEALLRVDKNPTSRSQDRWLGIPQALLHKMTTSDQRLFNTSLRLRDAKSAAAQSTGANDHSECAFAVDVAILQDNIIGSVRYSAADFSCEQATIITDAFKEVISGLCQDLNIPLANICLVSQQQLNRIIEFSGQDQLSATEQLIFHEIDLIAQQKPELVAIDSWDGSWTYAELSDATTRLSHHLLNVGVTPGSIILHCFEKSGWAIVSMIAISKAGCAFAALDLRNPPERLLRQITQVGGSTVLGSSQTSHLFDEMSAVQSFIRVDRNLLNSLPQKARPPFVTIKPSDLACVVFSSGTTGEPKAIAVEHRSICTFTSHMGQMMKLDESSRVFQFAAYTFDASNGDIFPTLQRGGCVCVPSEEERLGDLAGAIRRLNANSIHTTDTVVSMFEPSEVPNLKRIYCGGERMTRQTLQRWASAVELFNVYGPTEATIDVFISEKLATGSRTDNIGRPSGCRAWIVDSTNHNQLLPIGATGELVLEGPMLARGYFGNQDATNASFVADPHWGRKITAGKVQRVYKTGDICRFNTDGTLTIIGRRDNMVKIHGQRVELGDISFYLQSEIGQDSSVAVDVLPVDGNAKSTALVAFVQQLSRRTSAATSNDCIVLPSDGDTMAGFLRIKEALGQRLPKYMIPSVFIPLTTIPTNPSGKLDKRGMRKLFQELSDAQIAKFSLRNKHVQLPSSPGEKLLARLWGQILRVPEDEIDIADDFFYLGGDSVAAIKLVAAARASHVSLSVPDIFRHPLLVDMAQVMRQSPRDNPKVISAHRAFDLLSSTDPEAIRDILTSAAGQCDISLDDIEDIYPCTPFQRDLLARPSGNRDPYRATRIFKITDENFNITSFKASWHRVIKSESILRTRVIRYKSQLLQVVLRDTPEWAETTEPLTRFTTEDDRSPFTLGAPLLRLSFVKSGGEQYFVWSAHHSIYDRWSVRLTIEAVDKAMVEKTVPTTSTPFKQLVKYIHESSAQAQRDFWALQFPEHLPPAASFPALPHSRMSGSYKHISMTASLDISHRRSTATFSNLLHVAWGLVVSVYSGSNGVVLATTRTGRASPVPGIMTINGPAISIVPVRTDMSLDRSVEKATTEMQAQLGEIIEHEHYGLHDIAQINKVAGKAITGITSVLVVHHQQEFSTPCFDGMEIVSEAQEAHTLPLVVGCRYNTTDTLVVDMRFDAGVLPPEIIQSVLEQYCDFVQQMVREPQQKLSSLTLQSAESVGWIHDWHQHSNKQNGRSGEIPHIPVGRHANSTVTMGEYMKGVHYNG